MKFIELHLSDGGMMTVNINSITNFIKQKNGGTYINFIDGSAKTVEENYETLQGLVGLKSEESVYNNPDVEFES